MNEQRETKEIITPIGKHKLILKAWVTGREKRSIRKPLLNGMKFEIGKDGTKLGDIKSSDLVDGAEDAKIQAIVVSVNDKNDKVLDAILDMQEKDYAFVVDEINRISKDEDFRKPEVKQ